MKRFLLPLLLILLMICCKNPAPDLNGTEPVKAEDFLKAFHERKLPITIADTSLKNIADSILISKTVFAQFIADSATANYPVNAAIHPAGVIHKKERDFLLATFSSPKKIQLTVFILDDKHKFLASFPLLNNTAKDGYRHSLGITEEPTFILKKEKITKDNTLLYSRNGYAYNTSSNNFEEVLHDSNEDTARMNEIINPIDTLPQLNKYSGDYAADKKNFISIRDGKNAQSYFFFIHFEKTKGDCTGELKGEMTLKGEKDAVFTESGDPCIIDFKFTGNSVKIKEQGNCGNHRGITCPYDFTFKKRTQPKKNKTK